MANTPPSKRQKLLQRDRAPGVLFTVSVPSKLRYGANCILSIFDAANPTAVVSDASVSVPQSSSVSDAISLEISQMSEKKLKYRFSSELSRGIGLLAFPSDLLPSEFVHMVLMSHLPAISPLYVSRLIPLDFTCAPNIVSFEAVMIPHIQSHFEACPDQTWKVVLDKHGLTNITRDNVISLAQTVIPERHEVSIQCPDTVIMIQITQTLCGLSFLRDYEALCEYNIRKLIALRTSTIRSESS